jgi:peptidoglycan/xylan/chitin deacetylase (PgdA/CDA1 family)
MGNSKPDRVVCFTCDVEIGREEGLQQLAPILNLLDYYNVPATFFVIVSAGNYRLLENFELSSRLENHEIGLHIHWGESSRSNSSYTRGLDALSTIFLEKEMRECLEYCRKLNFRPTSFRGVGLCQTTEALKLIAKSGFHVDSSVAARLNEINGWFQKHTRVPYRSWYFPSKDNYDVPASDADDTMGVLEIPVTRLIPSLRAWWPYTLNPNAPLILKIITNEWLLRPRREHPLVIVPLFHNWEIESRQHSKNYDRFLRRLSKSILYLISKGFVPLKIKEVYDLVA